jgi:hypothetical protein
MHPQPVNTDRLIILSTSSMIELFWSLNAVAFVSANGRAVLAKHLLANMSASPKYIMISGLQVLWIMI